jgi:hypothetical protein
MSSLRSSRRVTLLGEGGRTEWPIPSAAVMVNAAQIVAPNDAALPDNAHAYRHACGRLDCIGSRVMGRRLKGRAQRSRL